MAECWSCGAERGAASFCTVCSKIQPPAQNASYFSALDLPAQMSLKTSDVDSRFREASKRVHPDRFAQESAIERRIALEQTTLLNQAHRALRDPQSRAEYLMHLQGVEIGSEEARTQSPALLMAMMERQEQISDAKDQAGLEAAQAALGTRQKLLLSELTRYFDAQEGSKEQAVLALDELRYLRRLIESAEVRLEEMS